MSLITGSARHIWKIPRLKYLRQPSWAGQAYVQIRRTPSRGFNDGAHRPAGEEAAVAEVKDRFWEEYKRSFSVPKPTLKLQAQIPSSLIGTEVTIVGSIENKRDISAKMSFASVYGEGGSQKIQLLARPQINEEAFSSMRAILPNSAVSVTGTLCIKFEPKVTKEPQENPPQPAEGHVFIHQLELRVQSITCLNSFPKELQQSKATDRHLQIRFDPTLKSRLELRSKVAAVARQNLQDFTEIETPVLFKSTPEGAREFIVPTRMKGYGYSLPQSPQQYKQLLIAGGVHRYMQFARCFRDEDHRSDRQPEFTQIDLEMAWANGEDVMHRVEGLMKAIWLEFSEQTPVPSFDRMGYHEAMSKHGSDKPDLRIPGLIHRIDHILPENLTSMLTSIKNPTVEVWKMRLNGDLPTLKKFVSTFMDSHGKEFEANPDGAPGVFIFDPIAPLEGLHAFGFEGAEQLKTLYSGAATSQGGHDSPLEEGDILIVQARQDVPHSGGSTKLGKFRRALFNSAVSSELAHLDPVDRFLWVVDFPMFTPNDVDGEGQGGKSGFSATHHPFTAPKTAPDVDLLLTDPLSAIADHYDLVLNGVELGGGSRRIHSSEMQQFIMRDILKMDETRIDSFSHLFKALRAGCPPHAGLAIGFDRLIAVMTGQNSVRDVIAFPKDNSGRDLLVNSPGQLSDWQLEKYHIQVASQKKSN